MIVSKLLHSTVLDHGPHLSHVHETLDLNNRALNGFNVISVRRS